MGPDKGSGFFPHAYFRQSNAFDLGAMAKRAGAKYLMLTHMIPPLGAERQGPFKIPGGPLTEADYRKAVEESGFTGNVIVGTDLVTLRLPANCSALFVGELGLATARKGRRPARSAAGTDRISPLWLWVALTVQPISIVDPRIRQRVIIEACQTDPSGAAVPASAAQTKDGVAQESLG